MVTGWVVEEDLVTTVAVEESAVTLVVAVEDQDTLKDLYVLLLLELLVVMVVNNHKLQHQRTQVHTTLLVLHKVVLPLLTVVMVE